MLAELAAANAAFDVIKQTLANGREIYDAGEALALHHTDGVNSLSLIVKKDLEKDTTWTAGVSRSLSDDGATNSIIVGLVKKF